MSVAPVPPATMKPGICTFFSMKANTRLTAKADNAYRPVTARYTSMPREVSSCACMANMVSSAIDTANATDEFFSRFIDSLVSGGRMMRSAIGRMT
jgi:hypothetical protein